jgi:hypothetical protein
MKLTEQLIAVADAFATASNRSRATISTKVLNAGRRLDEIASGDADLSTGNFEKAMRWFDENWPLHTKWPEGVDRPIPRQDSA